jgi:hypothetical protein
MNKFKWHIIYPIRNWWNYFWYDYHWNGIIGPGGHSTKTFKEGRLGLVISIVLVLCFIGYLILK